jgi:gas vesicle protein
MTRERKSITAKVAIGTGVGLVLGVIAGILIAPKSGKEMRANLGKAGQTALKRTEKQLKSAHEELSKIIAKAQSTAKKVSGRSKENFSSLVEKAKVAKNNVAEIISAVRAGEATDKDLQKALTTAKQAKKHLQDFLKKSEKSSN